MECRRRIASTHWELILRLSCIAPSVRSKAMRHSVYSPESNASGREDLALLETGVSVP